MAGISLSGLASGMDTNSMISQLMAAEAGPRTQMANQQTIAQAKVKTLQSIQTKLTTLQSATTALRSVTNWIPTQTVESSDATSVTATRTGGAAAGSYTIDVKSLASSSQKTFSYTPPSADDTLSVGNVSVNLAAGASIDDAVSAINQAGGNVVAVNAQGKLVVSSNQTGSASTFSYTGGSVSMDSERVGKDATYTIDGGALQTSSTNAITSALPGIDVTVKKLGTASLTIGAPAPDSDALTSKVKAFVDAYNAVVDATQAATTEKPVSGASSSADLAKGTLFGDSGLTRMLSQLRNGISDAVPGLSGAFSSLADLGISTGAASGSGTYSTDAVNGKLVFDSAKFQAALKSNPSSVRELLGAKSGTSGFAQKFETLMTPMTQTGSGIADRISTANSVISRLTKSISDFDDRASKREDALRAQFSAMESALQAAQAQQSQLTSALAGLSG